MRYFLSKALSIFIPVRKWRHSVRGFINNFQIENLFVQKKEYDLIFSLGEACFTAEWLKVFGQRKFSAPFDWVYGGTFDRRIEAFIDEFSHYFDREDLEFIDEKTGNGAKLYRNNRTGLMYVHDFWGSVDFDSEYLLVNKKYKRRCDRIIDCINGGGRVLCIYAEQVWKTPDNLPDPRTFSSESDIVNLTNRLNKKYNDQIDLIYFKINKNISPDKLNTIYKDKNLTIVEYHGALGGNAMPGDENIERIIMKSFLNFLYYARSK